jgi:hypothetical protein
MRLFFAASMVSLVLAAGVFACSSGESAATPADAGKDAKAVVKTGDDDDDKKDDSTTTTDTPSDAGTTDGSADGSPGTAGGELTTTGDGGIACDTDAFREAEVNNDPATANKLTVKIGSTKVCGQVTSADPDFITFKMPEDATNWFVQPKGNIKISGTIDGQAFQGTNFGNLDVKSGATWVVKVETGSADARAWQLRFDFDQ